MILLWTRSAVTDIDAVREVGGSHGSAVGGAAKLAGFVAAAPDQDEKENVEVVEADVLDLGAKHGSDENLVVKAHVTPSESALCKFQRFPPNLHRNDSKVPTKHFCAGGKQSNTITQ